MKPIKFITSFSGDKDSMLALDRMIAQGHHCLGLLVSTNDDHGSWFHDVDIALLNDLAKKLGMNILHARIRQAYYNDMFETYLSDMKSDLAFEAVVFGDIDIIEHRMWCEARCQMVGVKALFPLWQEDRELLVREFINKGYKALLKRVNKNYLDQSFLKRTLDLDMIEEFKVLGIDVCGENGEYHTLVYDGPLFLEPLDYQVDEIIESENCFSLKIYPQLYKKRINKRTTNFS
jgi:uncharacterized protein (TIGR00290 family)